MKTEAALEQELNDKGLNAPRLTPEMINAVIGDAVPKYHVFPGTTVTVCCLTLRNGYSVVGHSACVSSSNFNEGIGRRIAYENARNKIWELEGYLLANIVAKNPGRNLGSAG